MLFLILSIFIVSETISACPPDEDVKPHCQCSKFVESSMMTCRGVFSPDDLVGPVLATRMSGVDTYYLAIENSSLLYIPNSIFMNTKFQKIRFLSTQIMSLSDSDLAFEGLEDTLLEIRATDAHYVTQWDWKQLRNLKHLQLIDVNWVSLGAIDHPFPDLPELSMLGIIRAEITFIVDYAFAGLKNLKVLNMKSNDISEIKRSMLPEPAYNLLILDFSDNELSVIPEDFFRNMPALDQVHLHKNKFLTLPEKVFKWAFLNLQELMLHDNPFRCDCRLRWLPGLKVPLTFTGKCVTPASLQGTSLKSLNLKSLYC